MSDLTHVRIALDLPRPELEAALAAAIGSQMQSSLADALRSHKSAISDELETMRDRVTQIRGELEAVHDGAREKQDSIRDKMDELSGKIDTAIEAAKNKLKDLEDTVNTRATRYIIPTALVVITALVLGAFSIFGGFKVQEKTTADLTAATQLGNQLNDATTKLAATKSSIDSLDQTLDEATRNSLIVSNTKLNQEVIALRAQVKQLQTDAADPRPTASKQTSTNGKKEKGQGH
jgi:DNA repair exonuclease SbcCD ATPase subunit